MFDASTNFGSQIQVSDPFNEGALRRASMAPLHYGGPNNTRSVFARALQDQTGANMRNTFAQQSQEYQQKAQQARAQDVQSRRENALANYALDQERNVTTSQQDTKRNVGRADISAYLQRARADYKVNRLSNIVDMFAQLGMLIEPSASMMYRSALASRTPTPTPTPSFTSGMEGIFGAGRASYGAGSSGPGMSTNLFERAPILSGLKT